jgi:hypothetical protein
MTSQNERTESHRHRGVHARPGHSSSRSATATVALRAPHVRRVAREGPKRRRCRDLRLIAAAGRVGSVAVSFICQRPGGKQEHQA